MTPNLPARPGITLHPWMSIRKDSISPVQQITAACVGGMITAVAVCPFDVVKTRLQAQIDPKTRTLSASRAISPHIHLNGTLDAFWKILRHEGVFSFWRGLGPSLIMAIPTSAIYFYAYENFKKTLDERLGNYASLSPVFAGFSARMLSTTATCPLELVRTYIQAHSAASTNAKDGLVNTLSRIVKTRGIVGLWAGLGPTLLRDAPFSAVYWFGYENLKMKIIARWNIHHGDEKFLVHFLSGAGAGTIAASVTTPIDVVKTRRQMHLNTNAKHPEKMRQIFVSILREEGAAGLFKGIVPRVMKIAPASAIMISSYELLKHLTAEFG